MTSNPTYPITGIQDGLERGSPDREVPLRVEIDDFYIQDKYATQRSLFLLAMAYFQTEIDYNEKLSYFQIAGIHGLPHVTWDDPNCPFPAQGPEYSRCSHKQITFPTWYRPYLLLFEQRLYEIMNEIVIPTFDASLREQLEGEARKWRLPYWDWAAKKQRKTEMIYDAALILRDRDVKVLLAPFGTEETTIPNPIYQFTTRDHVVMETWGIKPVQYQKDPPEYINFEKCNATSKVPPSADSVTGMWNGGVQDIDAITKNIQDAHWEQEGEGKYALGEAVYRLLSSDYITSYRQFASVRYEPEQNPRDALSWEGIQDNLRKWIGGTWGHMAHDAVAALDPIFWMHHANVDRVFAIYQALYPSNKLSWWVSDETTYTDDNGNEQRLVLTPETPLTPFHTDDKGTMYNSNGVRHVADLGYTYPELQRWCYPADAEGESAYQANIVDTVAKLYAPPAAWLAASTDSDYIVNVIYERFALGGVPFTVQILLHDKLVGSVYNFSAPPKSLGGIDGCENYLRQEQSKILSSGQVTLTGALLACNELAGDSKSNTLDKDKVQAYLKKNLRWRVFVAGDTEIPLLEIPSLKVVVAVGRRESRELKPRQRAGLNSDSDPLHMEGIYKKVKEGIDEGLSHWGFNATQRPRRDIMAGDVTLDGILTAVIDHRKRSYNVIKVTPSDSEGQGKEPVRVVLLGYSEYDSLSLV